jgi:hypothetical protein
MAVSRPTMVQFKNFLIDVTSVMSPHATLLSYSSPENIKDLRDQAALISMLWREKEGEIQAQSSKTGLPWPQPRSEFTVVDESVIPEGTLETLTIEFDKVNIIVRAIQPRLLLVLIGGIAPNPKSTQLKITVEKRGDQRYPTAPKSSRRIAFDVSPDNESDGSRQDSPHLDFLEQPANASSKQENLTTPLEEQAADVLRKNKDLPTPTKEPSSSRSDPVTPHSEQVKTHRDAAADSEAPEARQSKEPSEIDDDVKLGLLHIQRKKLDHATEYMRADFKAKGFLMPHQDIIP